MLLRERPRESGSLHKRVREMCRTPRWRKQRDEKSRSHRDPGRLRANEKLFEMDRNLREMFAWYTG